jgi:hypothetical protein
MWLADEHGMYERYVTEGIKKGIVKKPKQIQAHKKTRTDETKHYVTIFLSFLLK